MDEKTIEITIDEALHSLDLSWERIADYHGYDSYALREGLPLNTRVLIPVDWIK